MPVRQFASQILCMLLLYAALKDMKHAMHLVVACMHVCRRKGKSPHRTLSWWHACMCAESLGGMHAYVQKEGKSPMQYIQEAEPILVEGPVVASYGSE